MNKNLKKTTYTGLFAALIFVLTLFLHVPVASGYVHFGDAMLYICAVLLGNPYALIAGALGEGLADVAGGFAIYAPATVLIKIAIGVVFAFAKNDKKLLTIKSALFTLPAGIITVGGYFLADCLIDKTYALVDIPGNVIQTVGSAVIFIVVAFAMDKTHLRDQLKL